VVRVVDLGDQTSLYVVELAERCRFGRHEPGKRVEGFGDEWLCTRQPGDLLLQLDDGTEVARREANHRPNIRRIPYRLKRARRGSFDADI
jgi:hypothetical protein